MKKFLLGSAALVGMFVGPTMAADMRVKAPQIAAPAPFSWAGAYIGVNVGGTWGNFDTNSPLSNFGGGTQYIASVVADINAQAAQKLTQSGVIGGVQWGYNVQVGNVVAGFESDINSFRLSKSNVKSAFFTGFPGPGIPPTYTDAASTDWLYTSRGRIGYASDSWMIYGTGGLALTNLKYTHTFTEGVFAGSSSGVETSTISKNKYGLVAGGGFEYAWSRNVSVKAEYLHLDFGTAYSSGRVVFPGGPGTSAFLHSVRFTADIARIGLNYRFGSL